MKAVIVTGDRYADIADWGSIVAEAFRVHRGPGDWLVVIQGGANGIDSIAGSVVNELVTYDQIPVYAQWGKHGKAAGPKRNGAMLSILSILAEHGYQVACLAFHDDLVGSKGTKNMVNLAVAAGVETWHYTTYNDPVRITEVKW